jgi:hypothetical protein
MPAVGGVDLAAADAWIRRTIAPTGPLELVKQRPWATVLRVPTAPGRAYFKACRPVQAFEPRLTAALSERWPDRVPEVLAWDADRSWLLLADAGVPLLDLGNPPERWLEVLPRYAELQKGETPQAAAHLRDGVPDLRLQTLTERFEGLLARELPLDPATLHAGRAVVPNLAALAGELGEGGIADTVEHADLHSRSFFALRDELRVLDWGDASIGHPFLSLVVTFDYLRDSGVAADEAWFARLRDAYLEPWGPGPAELFQVAQRLGRVSRALGWLRHHEAMGTGAFQGFDEEFPTVLRTAIDTLRTTLSA